MNENELLIDDKRIYPIRTCRNYQEGITALQEKTWDKLYLDWDMGTGCMNGFDVLYWLEKNPQHLPRQIEMLTLCDEKWAEMTEFARKLYVGTPHKGA
jgi:CheY-like chemotaxis protein